MGGFRKTGDKEAKLKRMWTHPEFQRRGFGQQIYQALEQKAREMGYTRLHLQTGANQLPAQQLYTKNGFLETHRGPIRRILPSIFYEKYLLSPS